MEAEPPYFDDNILHKILLRLPAKPLARCKVINKAWNDMISCSFFVATQSKRSINRALGIYSNDYNGHVIDYTSLDDNVGTQVLPSITLGFRARSDDFERIKVEAECCGLVFFELTSRPKRYILSNPTTNSYLEVCRPPEIGKSYDARFGLAFDPSMSLTSLKLVMCWRRYKHSVYNFTIYSPVTKTWQASIASIPCGVSQMFNSVTPVFLNGVLHWLREEDIVAYNVEEERAYWIRLPEGMKVSSVGRYPSVWFGAVRGQMTVVSFDDRIRVYVMEDYWNGSWKLKRSIEIEKGRDGYHARLVPVFYGSEMCAFFTSKLAEDGIPDYGLAVYWIYEKRWNEFKKIPRWMDRTRHFFPDIINMVVLKF